MRGWRVMAGVVAALGAVLPGQVTPALAATAGAPVVRLTQPFPHGYIETTLNPGQSFATSLEVSDGGTVAGSFLISAVDGYTSSSGGVVYGNRALPFRDGPAGNGEFGAGRWITVSTDHLTLSPGASQTVGVSVTVPAGTHPGDWVGGVTAENPQATGSGGGAGPQLRVTEANEMAVVVHVPGATSSGAVFIGAPTITVDGAQQLLNIPLRYTGDVLTKPLFSFTIRDGSGHTVYSHSGRFDTFVPHTTIVYQVRLLPVLPPGSYSFSGSAGPDGNVTSSTYAIPVSGVPAPLPAPGGAGTGEQPNAGPPAALLAGAMGVLLLLVLMLALLLRRRRNRCSHCESGRIGALMPVRDFAELARCRECRRRALEREEVRLCPECYRAHVLATEKVTSGTA
ncbi:MAG: hypothetical protein ACYDAC_03670 [Candidatus Dormibacteria bacterium]